MPHRAISAALLAALAVLVAASSASADLETTRLLIVEDDVTVLYQPDNARSAARVLEVVSSRGNAVALRAGLSDLGPVRLYLASTDDEFRTLTHGGVPDWGAGCAFPDRGVVVIRNPMTAPDPLGMEDVVAHEIAHIAAGRVLGEVRVPRWFHEGIAMTLAGEWRLPRSASQSAAGASGALMPLDELASGFPESAGDAMLAYSESFYAVRYLMDEAGSATPARVLRVIAEAGSFEHGLEALTGRSVAVFERDAVSSFRRRFGWGVLLTRWNILFMGAALLLLVGGAARLARRRRRLAEWEAEEGGRVASHGGSDSEWS